MNTARNVIFVVIIVALVGAAAWLGIGYSDKEETNSVNEEIVEEANEINNTEEEENIIDNEVEDENVVEDEEAEDNEDEEEEETITDDSDNDDDTTEASTSSSSETGTGGTTEDNEEKAIKIAKQYYEEEYGGDADSLEFTADGVDKTGDNYVVTLGGNTDSGYKIHFLVNISTGEVTEK